MGEVLLPDLLGQARERADAARAAPRRCRASRATRLVGAGPQRRVARPQPPHVAVVPPRLRARPRPPVSSSGGELVRSGVELVAEHRRRACARPRRAACRTHRRRAARPLRPAAPSPRRSRCRPAPASPSPASARSISSSRLGRDLAVIAERVHGRRRHGVDRVGTDQLLDVEHVAVALVLGAGAGPQQPLRPARPWRAASPSAGRRTAACSADRRAWHWRSRPCPAALRAPSRSPARRRLASRSSISLSTATSMRLTKKLATLAILPRIAALRDQLLEAGQIGFDHLLRRPAARTAA